MSCIVGMVQDSVKDGACQGLPSPFCVRLGFVGAGSEAGI